MSTEELREEKDSKTVQLLQFYEDYDSSSSTICYGFVEGKDDPSYYKNAINKIIPSDCSIQLYLTGNKSNVNYVYNQIDWEAYSKYRLVFFMDRDLSDLVEDSNIINDRNVYITDNYSFENDVVCEEVFEMIITEIQGFASTPKKDITKLKEKFKDQRNIFIKWIIPIMSNIIMWKRTHVSPACYNNLKIKKLLSINEGTLCFNYNGENLIKEVYKFCNVDYQATFDAEKINSICDEIQSNHLAEKIVRGKYIAEFFVMFCNSIYDSYEKLNIERTNNGRRLGSNDITETMAPRCRLCDSLRFFLESTIIKYYSH